MLQIKGLAFLGLPGTQAAPTSMCAGLEEKQATGTLYFKSG